MHNDFYEINISLKGQHFFATAERSIQSEEKLKKVYNILKEKFPKQEGYEITITRWEDRGHVIIMDEKDGESNE